MNDDFHKLEKDYKWDTCTNSPLLNQGYKFTGNKKFYADLHIALNSHSGEYSIITTSNMEISQHGYNASLESVSGLNK